MKNTSRNVLAGVAALAAIAAVPSRAVAQCTPVHNCQITSSTYLTTTGCPSSPNRIRTSGRGFDQVVPGFGTIRALGGLKGQNVVSGTVIGIGSNGLQISGCQVTAQQFEQVTFSSNCAQAVKFRVFGTYCLI